MTDETTSPAKPFRERIQHPDLRRLFDYWDSRRAGRAYPARRDLDPVEFSFALGNVTLVEVLYDPVRFRFRLMGTLMAQRVGKDLTGHLVDELPHQTFRENVLKGYHDIVTTGQPNTTLHEQVIEGRPYRFEVVRLPLAEDGKTINMLLLCPMFFEKLPAWPPLKTLPPGTIGPSRRLY